MDRIYNWKWGMFAKLTTAIMVTLVIAFIGLIGSTLIMVDKNNQEIIYLVMDEFKRGSQDINQAMREEFGAMIESGVWR